jgi:hypothetical protein
MEVGPLSLDQLIEAASSAPFTKIQDAARRVAPKPLKDWQGVWPGMRGNPHGSVTVDYYIEGNRVRVHKTGDAEDLRYILSGEQTHLCKCGHEESAHTGDGHACTEMLHSDKPIISNKVLSCHCQKFVPQEQTR